MKWTPEAILALRRSRGETQQEMATALNVAVPTVNRWERGKAKPSKHTAKLLDALAAKAGE